MCRFAELMAQKDVRNEQKYCEVEVQKFEVGMQRC
jgi:hypothetical protein